MAEPTEIRRRRLLYQASHRGFKEADLVIGGFAARAVPLMSAEELDEFEALLGHSDPELYAWAIGAAPAPPDVAKGAVFRQLKAFDVAAALRDDAG